MLARFLGAAIVTFLTPSLAHAAGLYVCNESGEHLEVAYADFANGTWTSNGWTSVDNQACAQLSTSLTNTRTYVYAVGDSGKVWGADHPFCVSLSTGFNIPHADSTAACMAKNFFSVWVPDMITGAMPDHYVVLIGPNNTGLDNPRAER